MISSTSSSDPTSRAGNPLAAGPAAARPRSPRADQVSTESGVRLQAELARQPEIRPEVLARAQVLAADPDYPSAAVIRRVGEMILEAPDLSEDES